MIRLHISYTATKSQLFQTTKHTDDLNLEGKNNVSVHVTDY